MKYVLAISGGIDSVVLLDMLVTKKLVMPQAEEYAPTEIIVAHFDHGIRDDSAADARFVEGLALRYGLPFVSERAELGKAASEEQAREVRYDFLRRQADQHRATIVTAHHGDDVCETIALNLTRGTGWRGLAILAGEHISRPLLAYSKSDLYDYALANRLEWVEDSTNATNDYLRNRLRHRLQAELPASSRQQLLTLWGEQVRLRQAIDIEAAKFLTSETVYQRYFLTHIDSVVAEELLRVAIAGQAGQTPTRPQARRALLAIKTARPGSTYQVGGGVQLDFTARTFRIQTSREVI